MFCLKQDRRSTQVNLKKLKTSLLKSFRNALIIKIIGILSQFLLIVLLTKRMRYEDVGNYFLIISIVFAFSSLMKFSIDQSSLKAVSDAFYSKESVKEIFLKICSYFLFTSSIVIFALFLLKSFLSVNVLNNFTILENYSYILLWALLSSFSSILSEIFRALKKFVYSGLVANCLVNSVMVIYILSVNDSFTLNQILKYIIFLNLIVTSLFSVLCYRLTCRLENNSTHVSLSFIKMLKISFPLLISQVAMFLLTQSELWFVSSHFDKKAMSFYGVSMKLILLNSFFIGLLGIILPSYISDFRIKGETEKLRNTIRFLSTLVSIPSFVILFLLLFFTTDILGLVFGPFYLNGEWIVRIMCIPQFVSVVVGPCGYLLLMYGYNYHLMYSVLVSSFIAMTLSFTFITLNKPVEFIAVSFSIASVLNQVTMFFLCRKKCGVNSMISIRLLLTKFKYARTI